MVDWHPTEPHLLLTSGFDPAIRLLDLRQPGAPLRELRGHMAPGVQRCRGIYRPAFVASGDMASHRAAALSTCAVCARPRCVAPLSQQRTAERLRCKGDCAEGVRCAAVEAGGRNCCGWRPG